MADWIVIFATVILVIRKFNSLTEVDVGRGWLRLTIAQDRSRLVETHHRESPVRRKPVKD
jgi:hypothetical protein